MALFSSTIFWISSAIMVAYSYIHYTKKEDPMEFNTIEAATNHFNALVEQQMKRIADISTNGEWVDYTTKKIIRIGICWGDGIGEHISNQAERVLRHVCQADIRDTRIQITPIKGLTIENRAAHKAAIPDDVLAEIKQCDVILKGPTTTPQKGDQWPNIESANVAMRRELDLFACVRPVRVPDKGIDWTFFRENTEGAYMLGSKGIDFRDFSIDFKVISNAGADRIIRLAFEYAKANGKRKVSIVTKSNVIKSSDGRFSERAMRIAKEYEPLGIFCDEWYIDIMAAKLLDENRQREFEVFVMPNLYGDILTDEASQIQGGVGTAGSANIGTRYAMFEAVHGSAPRMVKEGRAQYADPSSMIKASAMLLRHIGFGIKADAIEHALDACVKEDALRITGHSNGVSSEAFTNALIERIPTPS
jgi:isocitrate dehydrogenase (NAD+)